MVNHVNVYKRGDITRRCISYQENDRYYANRFMRWKNLAIAEDCQSQLAQSRKNGYKNPNHKPFRIRRQVKMPVIK